MQQVTRVRKPAPDVQSDPDAAPGSDVPRGPAPGAPHNPPALRCAHRPNQRRVPGAGSVLVESLARTIQARLVMRTRTNKRLGGADAAGSHHRQRRGSRHVGQVRTPDLCWTSPHSACADPYSHIQSPPRHACAWTSLRTGECGWATEPQATCRPRSCVAQRACAGPAARPAVSPGRSPFAVR